DDGAYQVEIMTDATALAEKLAAASGAAVPVEARADLLQALLMRFDPRFRERAVMAFDAPAAHPDITYRVRPGSDGISSPLATVRLTGRVPDNSRSFMWSYGWTFASYAMTVHRDGATAPETLWLEGGERSKPLSLVSRRLPSDRLRTAW